MTHCPIVPNPKLQKWEVYTDFVYITKAGIEIVVEKGFKTDLASIPSLLKWIYPKCRLDYATAAVVHDWLLVQKMGREYADSVFREILDISTDERTEAIFYDGVSFWTKIKRIF